MKIKKLLSLLAATAMAVTALTGAMTASASEVANGTCGEGITWTLDENGKLTISGEGEMASPKVTDSTQPLASIESQIVDYSDIYTYKAYKEAIKEVVIEDGVKSIGVCAFYKMPNLETVVLPSTISEFKGIGFTCKGIEPAAGGSTIDDYASFAFAGCAKLVNLTLNEGVQSIGAYSFYECTSLTSVTIPKSIKKWGVYAFSKCSKLSDITLTEGLTIMGSFAFSETAVKSIVIPSTIEIWNTSSSGLPVMEDRENANCAFDNCTRLSSVTFNSGIKIIGTALFSHCPFLKKVAIPKSVTKIRWAFSYCSGLQEVYIEEGAQLKKEKNNTNPTYNNNNFDYVFYGCEGLRRLELPEGIDANYLNAQWCSKCTSLTDIYIHNKNEGWIPAGNDTSKIHCYFDTATYNTLLKDYPERLVDISQEISSTREELNTVVNKANELDENKYTPESYGALKALIEKAESYGEDSNIMSMEDTSNAISKAIKALEEKPQPADYTAVDAALAKIPSDLSVYTDETVKALNDAKEAVVRDLTIDEQERVNGFANAIEEAIAGLKKKPNSNTGSDKPQNPNQNTNKPNQPTSSKDKGKTPTNKVTVPKPAQVKSVKATAKKKKLNVSWKKVSGATGYEVMYATNNKFTKGKKTVKVKKNKVTLKKLKAKKKYFVKVRAYKKVKGNVSYGKWSKVVKKKVK